MTEEQELLTELLRPIWLQMAKKTGKQPAYCKLIFLCEMNKKIGTESNEIIPIDKLTNEQIQQVIKVYETELQ